MTFTSHRNRAEAGSGFVLWVCRIVIGCAVILAPGSSVAQSGGDDRFPIFADGSKNLRPFGFHVTDYDRPETESSPLEFKCEYAMHNLSLSEDVHQSFRRQGFSDSEICDALLISGLKYHPETGRRLATYRIGNLEELKLYEKSGDPFGCCVVSEEHSFEIPGCFKGMTARNDGDAYRMKTKCEMRYWPYTGEPITQEQKDLLKRFDTHFELDLILGPSGQVASAELMVAAQRRYTQADIKDVLSLMQK